MYYIPLLLLIFFSWIEQYIKARHKTVLFHIAFCVLLAMLCLRYGQGTDYFGYRKNFYMIDEHNEVGFVFVEHLFRYFNLDFELFVFAVSVFQMICMYRAVKIFSPYKCLSLLLFYPTVYLTYMFGIRQGIVIAFFLGFMLKWLVEKKWKRYFAACLLAMTIHSVSIVFVLPLFLLVKKWEIKYFYAGIFVALWGGIFIYFAPLSWFSAVDIGSFQFYLEENQFSVSPLGLLERVVMVIIIIVLWNTLSEEGKGNYPENRLMYQIYLIGFAISLLFFPWSILSSRLAAAFKAVEIILIPGLIRQNKKWRQVLLFFIICYTLLMTTKNIMSYIEQGGYEGCNVLTYPYISIFTKELIELRQGG
ncbi:MAG: EpsG family protein [Blautia sp.]|nr:EpsG family protein [Blautia sp.]